MTSRNRDSTRTRPLSMSAMAIKRRAQRAALKAAGGKTKQYPQGEKVSPVNELFNVWKIGRVA